MKVNEDSGVLETVRGLWTGYALLAAHELGVLALLWREDCSTDQIAKRLSLDPRGARALLSTLRDIQLVEQNVDTYTLTSEGRDVADPEGALAGYLGFHTRFRRSWVDLPDRIRQGVSSNLEPNRSGSPELTAQYIKAMDALGAPVADELAASLDIKPGQKVLDLGGGSGVYARAILSRQPEAQVVLVDRPVVIRLVRESLEKRPEFVSNLQLVEGDYFTFDGKGQFDWVLVANVVHNERAEDNARIMHTCANALRRRGRLALFDYFLGCPKPFPPAGFDLLLLLISQSGRLYSLDECQSWLRPCSLAVRDSSKVWCYDLLRAERR